MTPKQLARALATLAPAVRKTIMAQLAAWTRSAASASAAQVEAAVIAGDATAVARLLLGDAVADALVTGVVSLPDAAKAFDAVVPPTPLGTASVTERAVVKATAEAALDAARLASNALPLPSTTFRQAKGALTIVQTTRGPSGAPAAARYGGDALRYLRATTRKGIVAAVQQGNAAGINPRDVARGLRDVVGLGESQAVWIGNLRAELQAGRFSTALQRQLVKGPIRSMIAARARSQTPLTKVEINRIVGTYADAWRAWHAETIARTVSLDLSRHASVAKAREAQASGVYGNRRLTKRWVTRLDERARTAHRALHGTTIPLAASFNDAGVLRDVPGGYNCRCALVIRVDIARGL